LYGLDRWGRGLLHINEHGHLEVGLNGTDGPRADLVTLVADLQQQGLQLPALVRFDDILEDRILRLATTFQECMHALEYRGSFRGVYPVKVNQQRHVIEELTRISGPLGMGLEVGSKSEIALAMAMIENPEAPVVCNGYKDRGYVELALHAQQLGLHVLLVIEKPEELDLILEVAQRMQVRPRLGVRARLGATGKGRWSPSSGEQAKFGLGVTDLLYTVERLREVQGLDMLTLLHFHVGSQVTDIHAFKQALREASRIFVELHHLGAPLSFIDVGGGLAVDYDGSRSRADHSANYDLAEYAHDVVWTIKSTCDQHEIPHPDVITEAGRAMVAHHSVLLVDVIGTIDRAPSVPLSAPHERAPQALQTLYQAIRQLDPEVPQRTWHEMRDARSELLQLFELGIVNLEQRAHGEQMLRHGALRLLEATRQASFIPTEMQNLERSLADIYFCNFSIFQSIPDAWAIGQLFPIVPIERLESCPNHRAVLADLTCDSDGILDQFISQETPKNLLEIHELTDAPYRLAVFLVGAYQEILGDLHNLFGDTHAVHVSLGTDGVRIDRVVPGDNVGDVLGYVQYPTDELVERIRTRSHEAITQSTLCEETAEAIVQAYRVGLDQYTYLQP
jgi:arginine decarboxylase